jgi:hypothetical protein
MKFRTLAALLMLLPPVLMADGCAGLPPQARPATIEPFMGNWTGDWRSTVRLSSGGTVQVEIKADTTRPPNGVICNATVSQRFQLKELQGDLRDGTLFFTTPSHVQLTFALYGSNHIEVTYFNPANQDRGTGNLSRALHRTSADAAKPEPQKPRQPGGRGQMTLAWESVPGADSYNIYISESPGVTRQNGRKIANASNPHTLMGLKPGTSYYVVVTAVNGAGESEASKELNFTAK